MKDATEIFENTFSGGGARGTYNTAPPFHAPVSVDGDTRIHSYSGLVHLTTDTRNGAQVGEHGFKARMDGTADKLSAVPGSLPGREHLFVRQLKKPGRTSSLLRKTVGGPVFAKPLFSRIGFLTNEPPGTCGNSVNGFGPVQLTMPRCPGGDCKLVVNNIGEPHAKQNHCRELSRG